MPVTLQRISEFKVLHWTPAADNPLVAGLPIGVVGFHEKTSLDFTIETGLVGKVDADRVITEFGRELDAFNGLAFGLGETQNFAEPLPMTDRRFSFSDSQVASYQGDLVRAASAFACWRGPSVFIPESQGESKEKVNHDSRKSALELLILPSILLP